MAPLHRQFTAKQNHWPAYRYLLSKCIVMSWHQSCRNLKPVMLVMLLNTRYKLCCRWNALVFHKLVCEHRRMNPHNTVYEWKLGVMAPLTSTSVRAKVFMALSRNLRPLESILAHFVLIYLQIGLSTVVSNLCMTSLLRYIKWHNVKRYNGPG